MGAMADVLLASVALGAKPLPTVATQQGVARDAFMNALRILHSMEPELPREAYDRFIDSPCEFLMTADEQTLAKIWAAIQERQPERYKQ